MLDAKTMTVTGSYDLQGKGGGCAGLAIDAKNGLLFAACREPQAMVVLRASDGAVVATLPIGKGTDGAVFNPATMEVFSSQGDGTLTIVKENSPKSFLVEQTLTTMPRAKTLTLDEKTNKLYLISAEYGAAPPPEPGQRPLRGAIVPGSFSILTVASSGWWNVERNGATAGLPSPLHAGRVAVRCGACPPGRVFPLPAGRC